VFVVCVQQGVNAVLFIPYVQSAYKLLPPKLNEYATVCLWKYWIIIAIVRGVYDLRQFR